MDDIIKSLKTNKLIAILVIACLMFVFFAFCPAVDVAGKAQANGFKVLFDGKGLGFSRFLSAIALVVPIIIVAGNFVNFNLSGNLKEHFNAICFAAGFVACILMAIVLPNPVSLAWGGWLYALLALAGAGVSCIEFIYK